MFIQTEETPNPATLKFMPGRVVMASGNAEFDKMTSQKSPLAQCLLAIEGISGVFLGHDFITVTRNPDKEWAILKPQALSALMEFFISARPILSEAPSESLTDTPHEDPIINQILELLDKRIRPTVAADGGDISFERFEEGILYLRMKGSCAGCPSSTATLKSGIESMMRHYVPEVIEVRSI